MVDLECVQLAFTEAIDGLGHVRDELGECRAVIGRYCLACLLTLRPCGRGLRLVRVSLERMSATTGTCLRVVLTGVPRMAHGTQSQLGSGWPRHMRADRGQKRMFLKRQMRKQLRHRR